MRRGESRGIAGEIRVHTGMGQKKGIRRVEEELQAGKGKERRRTRHRNY
jgi:hypothetical protein